MELAGGTIPASINDESLESWRPIASGGFGEIYRAKHKTWGLDVAIKLLRSEHNSCDSCLLKEADLMRHGGNPNVLRILGVYEGCPGGQPPTTLHAPRSTQLGLVMEYMERGSVMDLQRVLGGPPPWPLAFRIMHQIALGMNFLHQLSPPLLHLDLKPSNVLLDDGLNAKLTDFGLAKLARSYSNMDRKEEEEVGGTTSYMPPEAFEPSSYSPTFSSDVYSYGILLWSVMTGKQPYHNARISTLIRFRVSEGDRPDLRSVDSHQEHGLSDLIDLTKRCWDADPNQRPTFLECVNVTEKVYDLHKRKVHKAVYATLKQLDCSDKISSSLQSLEITPKTNDAGITGKSHLPVKTGTTPTQEKGDIVISRPKGTGAFAHSPPASRTNHKPAATGLPTNRKPLPAQRQISTPGIHLSNVSYIQIGSNNCMNIQAPVERIRQRHPTAPSRVNIPNSDQLARHQKNPDHFKP